MTTKDEALRLADSLERMSLSTKWEKQAAAELRRLYSVNQALLEALKEAHNALELFVFDKSQSGQIAVAAVMEARAAIAKATGEQA